MIYYSSLFFTICKDSFSMYIQIFHVDYCFASWPSTQYTVCPEHFADR